MIAYLSYVDGTCEKAQYNFNTLIIVIIKAVYTLTLVS
jgi:hypothetical protein